MPAPSAEQQAVIDALRTGSNIFVAASAGSGKTTTLDMVCRALPSSAKILAVVFAKKGQEAMRGKFPPNVECRTIHSICFDLLGRPEVSEGVDKVMYTELYGPPPSAAKAAWNEEARVKYDLFVRTAKLVDLIRQTRSSDPALLSQYTPYVDDRVLARAEALLAALRKLRGTMSYTGMLDAALSPDVQYTVRYDAIVGDEVQDWNAAQLEIVWRLANPTAARPVEPPAAAGAMRQFTMPPPPPPPPAPACRPSATRVILTGDPLQSIFMFQGADPFAAQHAIDKFRCRVLPLATTFRCAQSIVAEARKTSRGSIIVARTDAPYGKVDHVNTFDVFALTDEDMVVCRLNAPLVRSAFPLVMAGRAVRLSCEAKFPLTLLSLAGYCHGTHIRAENVPIATFRRQIEAYRKKERRTKSADELGRSMDNLACLEELTYADASFETAHDVKMWLHKLSLLPCDSGPHFTSIHQAKGLEAHRVWYLLPPPDRSCDGREKGTTNGRVLAGSACDELQEQNLRYVAITRAKQELIYVHLPDERM